MNKRLFFLLTVLMLAMAPVCGFGEMLDLSQFEGGEPPAAVEWADAVFETRPWYEREDSRATQAARRASRRCLSWKDAPTDFLPEQQKDRRPATAGLNNNPMPAGMGLFYALRASDSRYPPPALPGTGRVRIGVTFFLPCKGKG